MRSSGVWLKRSRRRSKFEARSHGARRRTGSQARTRSGGGQGIALHAARTAPIEPTAASATSYVNVDIDRAARCATIVDRGAGKHAAASDVDGLVTQGASFWPLQVARELDDAILHLRINELEIGDAGVQVRTAMPPMWWPATTFLEANKTHWLVNEIRHYWKRVLKRIDVTSRTLVTLVEPGSLLRRHARRTACSPPTAPTCSIGSREGDNRAPATIRADRDELRPAIR